MITSSKLKGLLKSCRRRQKGQAQVEFALTIALVVVVMFSILEMLIYVYTYSVLADAAKEGVRYAIVHGANSSPSSGPGNTSAIDGGTGIVKGIARFSLHSASNMTVTVDYNPSSINGASACNNSGCAVRVTVSYPYQPIIFGWPTFTVRAASQGRIVF